MSLFDNVWNWFIEHAVLFFFFVHNLSLKNFIAKTKERNLQFKILTFYDKNLNGFLRH